MSEKTRNYRINGLIGAIQADRKFKADHLKRHNNNKYGRYVVESTLNLQVSYLETAFCALQEVLHCDDISQKEAAIYEFKQMLLETKNLKVKYESI